MKTKINKKIAWSFEKNLHLKQTRGISFEIIEQLIVSGHIIDIIRHPNEGKYGHQKMFILCIDNYVYIVPFVEDDEKIFLKTIIPSRKMTKNYFS
ncbi:hypothetical protein NIES4101_27730 (plasmid) [Calothrix sp. NIES-4101]|nr:hypothetical protein NIES4101_27730 [Calothrix sp. NIES-4101]